MRQVHCIVGTTACYYVCICKAAKITASVSSTVFLPASLPLSATIILYIYVYVRKESQLSTCGAFRFFIASGSVVVVVVVTRFVWNRGQMCATRAVCPCFSAQSESVNPLFRPL